MSQIKVLLAEHFHSIQGEGYWAGTPMHFIRLPGCSVGKRVVQLGRENTEDMNSPQNAKEVAPALPTGAPAWQCETWDGRKFWCDTDFNKHEEMFLSDLLAETWEHHICITGGEPLIHSPIVKEFEIRVFDSATIEGIHIETSGTIAWTRDNYKTWLTISPKLGCLPEMLDKANEIKLLIGVGMSSGPLAQFAGLDKVYLSPINDLDTINKPNLKLALGLLEANPTWKLSVQLHKYLGLR